MNSSGILAFAIDMMASLYLATLVLQLILKPVSFYSVPILARLAGLTEPLIGPLAKKVRNRWRATFLVLMAVLVARGLVLGLLAPGMLIYSPAGAKMLEYGRDWTLTTYFLMSFQWGLDILVALFFVSMMVTALMERYTANPITHFFFRVMDSVVLTFGSRVERLGSPLVIRLVASGSVILASTGISVVFLGLLSLLSDAGSGLAANISLGLLSALYLGVYSLGFLTLVLIAGAVMSWFRPDPTLPLIRFIAGLSQPLLAPIQRFLPLVGGIDLSPIAAIFAVEAVRSFLVQLLLWVFRV